MQLLIGADPELFLRDRNKFVSGYGVIPGTKAAPYKVKQGAVQVDGMALEFNIDPAPNSDVFVNNIDTVLAELRKMVPDQYDLTIRATAEFDRKYMAEQPEEARMLGCDPDFNAYTGEPNPRPDAHPTMRTAAGHIHLGWTKNADISDPVFFEACCQMVIQMDYYLGLISIIQDRDYKRREMYGQPGAFRPKPYGLEYRVLSNYWLTDPQYMRDVFRNAYLGFNTFTSGKFFADEILPKKYGRTAKDIIENNDIDFALRYIKYIGLRANQ